MEKICMQEPLLAVTSPDQRERPTKESLKGGKPARRPSTVVEPSASLIASWSILANTMLGIGTLALPWACANTGLSTGFVLLVLAGLMSAFALHLLGEISMDIFGGSTGPGEVTYYDVCSRYAPRVRYIVDLAIAVKCFGVGTSYLLTAGQLGNALLAQAVGFENEKLRQGVIVVSALALTPMVFRKRISKTQWTNLFCISVLVYACGLVLLHCSGLVSLGDDILDEPGAAQPVWISSPPNAWALLDVIPVFIFAYTCHQNLFLVANEMKNRSQLRIDTVIGATLLSAYLFYGSCAVVAYTRYGSLARANILLNLPKKSCACALAKALMAINCVLTFPLQLHPCRRSIMIFIQTMRNEDFTYRGEKLVRRALTLAILLGAVGIGLLVNDLGIVFSIVGTVGSNTICIIMPAYLYLQVFRGREGRQLTKSLAWVLLLCGCAVLPLCLTAIARKISAAAA